MLSFGQVMNKLHKALRELSEMDRLAALDSPIHRLDPLAKFLVTVLYIAVTVSFGKYRLGAVAVMALFPVLLFSLSGIPVRTCFYKLRLVLPLVLFVGLFNPVFDRTPMLKIGQVTVSGGVISMLTLMMKGVFSLMASFLLVATTPIDSLCAALRKIRVHSMLVTLLLLTYRYVGVLTEEAAVMTDAYHLRAPGQRGIHISAWGSFLGQLLLRSMARAEDLYDAMQLRGYDGTFRYASLPKIKAFDVLFFVFFSAAILVCRFVNISGLIGGLFVR